MLHGAFYAKRIITLEGESLARGEAALNAPPPSVENAVVAVENGIIRAVLPHDEYKKSGLKLPFTDLGPVTLLPGFINAHCHLELSSLAGRTTAGQGFVPWLQSLLPLAGEEPGDAVFCAAAQASATGTAHIGDVGSRNPRSVAKAAARRLPGDPPLPGQPLGITHFLEAFGFAVPSSKEQDADPFLAQGYGPKAGLALSSNTHSRCAVSGHALYSTGPEALRAASKSCIKRGMPFSLHLAEHEDEEQALLHGTGPLADMLSARVLPKGRQAPGKRPVPYAAELGLLNKNTLAVHCVHCRDQDIDLLARAEVTVCLCPRSNAFIGVGIAPARQFMQAGIVLCLGTDSLASNTSLSMKEEMNAAAEACGLSPNAVLRMATINGAYALGLPNLGRIAPGSRAAFALADGLFEF